MLELESSGARKLGRRLRKVTRTLGPLREADVLVELTAELAAERRAPKPAWRRVAEHVHAIREAARSQSSDKAITDELRRLARKFERVAKELAEHPQGSRPRRAWRWAIDARVARRAQTLRAAMMKAGAVYLHERLHDVRIALKKLRYAAELAADADGLKATADLRVLKRAQVLLGRIHDLQVLTDHVRQVQAGLMPPDLAAWRELDAVVSVLEQDCRRLHARYVSESPRLLAVCERLDGRQAAAARRAS